MLPTVTLRFLIAAPCLTVSRVAADEHSKEHSIPTDKHLRKSWGDAFATRGERRVYRGDEFLTIGMPCGLGFGRSHQGSAYPRTNVGNGLRAVPRPEVAIFSAWRNATEDVPYRYWDRL